MKEPSGKFVLRIPKELHRRLKNDAFESGQSLNEVCLKKLEAEGASDSLDQPNLVSLIPQGIRDRIRDLWGAKLIGLILFGSAARGEMTAESDIDLLIVFESEFQISRGLYRDWDRILETRDIDAGGRPISPHFVSLPKGVSDAGGLWYEVAIEGVIIWESNLRISRFLQNIRRAITSRQIERIAHQGYSYWIKNGEGLLEE
jgi:predicted nucleotidyltransferase